MSSLSALLNKFRKFLPVVIAIGNLSKDRSTKIGAVAFGPEYDIRSTGYNGFARGVNDDIDSRHERPEKYLWTAHAEENVVAQAARAVLEGTTVLVHGLPCCSRCARMLINAGVKRIVIAPIEGEAKVRWSEDTDIAMKMLQEAGVPVVNLNQE